MTPGQEVILGVMMSGIRYGNTKFARNGNSRMVRCNLEDFSGVIECLMWPDDLVRHKDDFRENRVCFVKGSVERRGEKQSLVLTRVLDIEQAQREWTKGLVLVMNLGADPTMLDGVVRVLQRTPGTCPVYLGVRDGQGRKALLRLGEDYRINPATVSISDLEVILGTGCVKFTGPPGKMTR
jgi:DNA polymerase-3 subunit alpha